MTHTFTHHDHRYTVELPDALWPKEGSDEVRIALERYLPADRTWARFEADQLMRLETICKGAIDKRREVTWHGQTLVIKAEDGSVAPVAKAN